jgi:hypothetical protein
MPCFKFPLFSDVVRPIFGSLVLERVFLICPKKVDALGNLPGMAMFAMLVHRTCFEQGGK